MSYTDRPGYNQPGGMGNRGLVLQTLFRPLIIMTGCGGDRFLVALLLLLVCSSFKCWVLLWVVPLRLSHAKG